MTLIETSNGKINIMKYSSPMPSDKIVLCIHGFCCDARIFDYLGKTLSNNGFNVYSIDLPGHGKSYGEKGDLDFDKCLESIHELVTKLKGTSKLFILAHSMGCTHALWYAHTFKKSIDGLILFAPYVRMPSIKKRSEVEPSNSLFLYFLLRKMLTPTTKILITKELPNFLKIGGIEIEQMLNDKSLNFYYTYRYIVDVLALRNTKISALTDVDVPLLILHGKKDRNVFSEVGVQFCDLAKSVDKKINVLDCDHWFNHCMFYSQDDNRYSEESREQITNLVKDWISSH
ncbi:MAG: alpha/beta fold hydrolase [Thaumarchaeota archaeon]|nr:alpha/beta fold hydrolase [Nitrososphaerota archaeon]